MSVSLRFVVSPPGLSPLLDFTLTEIDGADGLYRMDADRDRAIRIFVINASVYLPDYAPVISDEDCELLHIRQPEDALVLVVTNPGEDGTTVNLLAPIVVNSATGICAQIILDGQEWPLRAQLSARSA
jgi:flagellar assembly factor FliW